MIQTKRQDILYER